MVKKTIQSIGAALAVIVILGGITLWSDFTQAPTTGGTPGSISLAIQGLYADKTVDITAGETALQLLQDLDAVDPAMQLQTKDYAGLGTLVEGMGSLHNGAGGNYWQYKVNDVMPQIGAGAYVLHDSDAVNWYFGASQE